MADSDLIQNTEKTDALADQAEENTVRDAIEDEPWRNSNYQTPIGEGITHHYDNEKFIGIKVSSELNDKIDPIWREPNGWYEDPQQAAILAISFPDQYIVPDIKTAHENAKATYPDAYKAFSAKMFEQPNEQLGYSADRNFYGEGISLFETPIETRLHVAPELNERIDPAWRAPDGWYDTDRDAQSIISVTFPERVDPSELATARQDVRDRYPEIYERIIAQTPPPRMDDQDDLTTSLEGSATKSTPDLKDMMAAFGPDPTPASIRSPEDAVAATPDVTAPAEPTQQTNPVANETSNSVEVSSAKPAPDLKDLLAVFDSIEEPTSKTAATPKTDADKTPGVVEAKTDTTAAPATQNTTEKRVVTDHKNDSPSTAQNSNPTGTTIETATNAAQSSQRQERQNDQKQNSDQAQQPITAAGIIAGAIVSGIANSFGRKPQESRTSPQEAAPARNEPAAPSPAQPAETASALKPETTAPGEPAAKASTAKPAQPTQTSSAAKTDAVAAAEPVPTTNQTVHGPSNPVGGSLPLRNLLTGFRSPRSESITPPVATPPTADDAPARPGSARALLDKFSSSRMQPRRDADQLQATEHAAATAVNSFEAMEKADSSAILTRIREAAETSPGGMKEVISEMRPGGAYEDLRKEFNATLSRDEHFSTAYKNASSALDAYANQRAKTAPILQNGNTGILSRLEAMDEKIVKAATELPGREAGKSTLDEAIEKAHEAVMNIVNSVRGAFSRQSPSASPSISP